MGKVAQRQGLSQRRHNPLSDTAFQHYVPDVALESAAVERLFRKVDLLTPSSGNLLLITTLSILYLLVSVGYQSFRQDGRIILLGTDFLYHLP